MRYVIAALIALSLVACGVALTQHYGMALDSNDTSTRD